MLQEMLNKHGLLDAYLSKTSELLEGSKAGVAAAAVAAGAGLDQRQQQQYDSSHGGSLSGCAGWLTGWWCSSKLRRKSSRVGCEVAATHTGKGTGSSAGGGGSVRSSTSGKVGSSGGGSGSVGSSAGGSGKVGSSGGGSKRRVWQPGPGDVEPLKTVWSPLAVLLLLVYLAVTGYYLWVRVVTSADLGNQRW